MNHELFKQTWTGDIKETAEKLGISYIRAARYRRRFGLPRKRGVTEMQRKDVLRFLSAGLHDNTIAKMCKLSRERVRQLRAKAGLAPLATRCHARAPLNNEALLAALFKGLGQGEAAAAIARKIGMKENTLRCIARRAGFKSTWRQPTKHTDLEIREAWTGSIMETAEILGCSFSALYRRHKQLKEKGINLPLIRRRRRK